MPPDATSSALIASSASQQPRAPSVVIEPRRGLFDLDLGALGNRDVQSTSWPRGLEERVQTDGANEMVEYEWCVAT